jgi:hypothetical protein
MARSSSKKPGEPKCRGTGAQVEGRDWVRIGGSKWLREAAEAKGKFIPLEYRKAEGAALARKTKAEKAAEKEAAQRAAEKAEKADRMATQAPPPTPPVDETPGPAEQPPPPEESFLDEAPDQDEPE